MNGKDFQRDVVKFSTDNLDEAVAEAQKYDGQIANDRPLVVSVDNKWCLILESTFPGWLETIPSLAYSPLDELQKSRLLSMIADLLNG